MQRRGFFVMALSMLVMLLVGSACSSNTSTEKGATASDSAPKEKIAVMALKGPSGVAMAQMMKADQDSPEPSYDVQLGGAPDEAVSALSSGSVDLAVLPTNLAATLYHKTKGEIKMIAIEALGSLYILEKGNTLQSIEDLKGKTILSSGKGATPQYVLEYLLQTAGLTLGKDVWVEYATEHTEVVTKMLAGKAEVVLLPEPFVSTALLKDSNVRIALDLNDLWNEATGENLAMSCIVARTDCITQHPEEVKQFLVDLKESVTFALTDVQGTAQLCAEYKIISEYATAEKAIPNCRITYQEGAAMEPLMQAYYEVLCAANPASIGGSVPDASFYYQA